jgi:2-dehydro-3-deoxyphosphogluconate aldolase/(4S)-4-hydroxy-2-oxoglutarate aldolase
VLEVTLRTEAALAAREMGYSVLKLFPAEIVGGVALLKALRPVVPDVLFCPTGSIDAPDRGGFTWRSTT